MLDELTRRRLLHASAVTATGLSLTGTASASTTDSVDSDGIETWQVPCLDATQAHANLEVVDAAAVQPETSNGIGPGSMLFIMRDGTTAGCTANFVWRDGGGTLYLGAAGHCFLPNDAAAGTNAGGSYDTSGVVTDVCIDCTFGGATALSGLRGRVVRLGDVAYARQSQDGVDLGNDFGLVEIPSDAEHLVDPSMPTWDGPTATGEINAGETVVQYGNGVGVGEVFITKNRAGSGLANDAGAWYAGLPGSPGDSGSAVQVARQTSTGPVGEEAAGILTHLTTAGTAGTNVAKARQLATQASLDISVVTA